MAKANQNKKVIAPPDRLTVVSLFQEAVRIMSTKAEIIVKIEQTM